MDSNTRGQMTDPELTAAVAKRLGLGPENDKLYCYGHGWDDIEKFDRHDRTSGLGKPFTVWICPPCWHNDNPAYNYRGVQEDEGWLTSVDAALGVLDKNMIVTLSITPRGTSCALFIPDQTKGRDDANAVKRCQAEDESLPRAILRTFLEAPQEGEKP